MEGQSSIGLLREPSGPNDTNCTSKDSLCKLSQQKQVCKLHGYSKFLNWMLSWFLFYFMEVNEKQPEH